MKKVSRLPMLINSARVPERQVAMMISVFVEEVLPERFLAAIRLLLQGGSPFEVFADIELVRVVAVSKGAFEVKDQLGGRSS